MREEHELADRLARGDESAFEALARSLERALYSHACRLLRDETQAEDAVQDALLLAYRGRSTFRGGSFKAWVFRILTNRCLDLIREARRRPTVPLDPPVEEESDDAAMQWADPAPDIETLVIGHEMVRLIEEALAAVPAEQRAAVMLRDMQGFDYEEIARITNSELGTVKSRIHRGRLAVRNYLVARGWRAGNPPGTGGVKAST